MKYRVGVDTSFLVQLLKGNNTAVSVWERVVNLEVEIVISTVVLLELKRLALQERFEREKYEVLEESLLEIAHIVNLDKELAFKAAAVSHGTGLPARDAIIYTIAKESGCKEFYTTDTHFKAVSIKKRPKIIFISP